MKLVNGFLPVSPSYCDDTGVARAKIMNRTSTCMHMVVRESTDKERELLKRTGYSNNGITHLKSWLDCYRILHHFCS